jgi:23S rRNA (adenine2503-C2)-methyltransferase
MGLARNLEAWEIVEQVRIVRRDLERERGSGARIHGVLFQGMGEPLANADRVIRAIRVLSEPSAQAIDMRNITVCTAGLPAGIRRLAREVPAARLGVSLGALREGRRRALMPIDGAHPLEEVLEAAGEHARLTGHAPMWAYTLLAGQNDGDEDAALLAELAKGFARRHGISPRISLIPFNSIGDEVFQRSPRLAAFRDVLRAAGVGSIVRYSGGGDVGAACGQLARARAEGAEPRPALDRPENVAMDPGPPTR